MNNDTMKGTNVSEKSCNEGELVHILDVVSCFDVRGPMANEFGNFPIFKYLGNGIIKENPGCRRNRDDILFYDVTEASDDFKSRFASIISEVTVNKVIRLKNEKSSSYDAPRITTLMKLDGVYGDLSRSELKALGHDFVVVKNVENGLRIVPVVVAKQLPDDLQLRIDTRKISGELLGKISSDLTELREIGANLYQEDSIILNGQRKEI